jgi:transposase InsO family protein
MGIQEVLSAPRSPWQRAYVERVIGTIRRECLDHVIVLNEASLYRHVKSFLAYYHESSRSACCSLLRAEVSRAGVQKSLQACSVTP